MRVFLQDIRFTEKYNSTPNVFVSANHSSSGGNRQPVHNGITAWVEVILFLHFIKHFHLNCIFVTPVEPNLVYLKEFLASSNFLRGNINTELVSYPFTSVIFHQIKCGEDRKIQDGVSKTAKKVERYLLDANDMILICLTRTKTQGRYEFAFSSED